MYSLLIDTHDKDINLCLYKDGKVLDKVVKETNHNLTNYTMPLLSELLKNNNIDVHNLNEIMVVIGPGSFTGVRIGVTIAKMLAYTLKINIKALTSFELYAVSKTSTKGKLVTVHDIKGVYGAEFTNDNVLINDYFYLDNNSFDEYIKDKDILVFEDINIDYESVYEYMKNKECLNPHSVNPLYVKMIEVLKHD